jgi:prepilin-type N-terminal cleavage/methylation domain-containing protein
MKHMPYRTGFTLIEIVVAVSLLTLLSAAMVSWTISQRRAGLIISERMERFTQALACVRAIEDDLLLGVGAQRNIHPQADGSLSFSSVHSAPHELAGSRIVSWQFQAADHSPTTSDGALVRQQKIGEQVTTRIVLPMVKSAHFEHNELHGLQLILEYAPTSVAENTTNNDGVKWTFTLRTDGL